MRLSILACLCCMGASLALAQAEDQEVHHHNISFGAGPAMAVGNATSYLSTAPFIRLAYGYRFNRLFQADAGFQMAFGAAHNQNPETTTFGQVMGGDHEFMFPLLGGRVYLPLPVSRIQTSIGGGAVHLHYSETAPNNGGGYGGYGYGGYGYGSGCYTCTTRGGWGGYGLANISYFLNSDRTFRIGTTLEYIAGSTSGQAVANFPATKTTDHWLELAFGFGLSF
ncbi:MAG: hypothetical protein JST11_30605 [Acidobacteria bacterium]|nr:hypothetical protein [Acidobacteriota bacterium]